MSNPHAVSHFQQGTLAESSPLQIWTSLDTSTPAGKARLVSLLQGGDGDRASDRVNEILVVTDILAHRVELLDESTGELFPADRIVLICEDGSTAACVSSGVRQSLQLLFALYGPAPWRPGMPLKLTQKSTRKGRRVFQLVPVGETADTAPNGRKGGK